MNTFDIIYGQEMTIDYGTKRGRGPQPEFRDFTDKIRKMLKTQTFQNFCNSQGVKNGSLLQITVGKNNIPYKLNEFGDYLDGYRIVKEGEDNDFLVKTGKCIVRPSFREQIIYHSEMFYVFFANKAWHAEKILGNDEWLEKAKVTAAFLRLAEERNYSVGAVELFYDEAKKRACWKANAVGIESKEQRELICCFDGGTLKDLPAGTLKATPKDIGLGRYLKTKFNHFLYEGNGKFVRLK